MIIGILSDTHDNLPQLEKAVAFFNKHNVAFVLHAGDFVAPFTLSRMKKLSCDWRGVFGNNDGEKKGLGLASEGKIGDGPLRLELDGRQIVVVHDINQLDLQSEKAALVVSGHTHKPEIVAQPARLLVNPGECSGWISGQSTVAIVDLAALSAKLYTL